MRPPIDRRRPVHEDEDEVRELHAAEIAMGLDDSGPGKSERPTVLQESGVVHQGRLGAAIQTLRLQGNTLRRFFGRFQVVEGRVDLALDRVAVVEWAVLMLLVPAGGLAWGAMFGILAVWLSCAARAITDAWLWWAP